MAGFPESYRRLLECDRYTPKSCGCERHPNGNYLLVDDVIGALHHIIDDDEQAYDLAEFFYELLKEDKS